MVAWACGVYSALQVERDFARERHRQLLSEVEDAEHNAQIHHVPLHRQVIPWAMRENIRAVHRADNWVETQWVYVD